MSSTSPCLTCGACCAFFRVSFYWGETQGAGGGVPDNLTEQCGPLRSCMSGTNNPAPRCTALLGDVGGAVRCTIYDNRPSPCRDFQRSGEDGQENADCDRARAAHGLPPLVLPPLPVEAETA
ncbi:YkgJ family cysteine cluster protein [Mangrovimicrobium sediminis]|uniref:YkgJ family cysteine cluster protein n=1 Tax=Mangrovimicrobium sediminis TaxID=2562682 RepID=A0A4Z0M5C6_9GAMM|nr:YkgJ family cysteine cluster protein [Haliea sp. SAOS-164]TGD74862.1 YkgJ family cysteine cluster protein [Haliea sp. SAOS-164]